MIKVISIFGTRPEAIKMAPVVREMQKCPDRIASRICVTAQHREMLDQVLSLFGLLPDYDLNVMQTGQSPTQVAAAVLAGLDAILQTERPDWVLVQGDTTTAMAAAIAAFHHRVKVGHVEAGLRSHDKWRPFPEESNRKIVSVVADLHFAPTERARQNLLQEGVLETSIRVTGNTVVDALQWVSGLPYDPALGQLRDIPWDKRLILVTAHRREHFGEPLEQICLALRDIVKNYAGKVHVVYPVHPNPNVQEVARRLLANVPGISLTLPLDYLSLVYLMKHATLVLTDSGGIQEEAPGLGKPVLVLREVTERPEAVEAGVARLVGANRSRIVTEVCRLLSGPAEYAAMAKAVNPYGDGRAAERIVRLLCAGGK